ncbi:MAG: type II toxin-antitoxin system VapC family toxin, partial [Planctomycetaceae bacterium]|nr:type II toxin-antitoxin system VapC family toxin [Planctomycetaceae bacterium]
DEYVKRLIILPVDSHVVRCASRIRTQLKMKRKTVDLADILIAATTLAHDIHFATINQKHFENIDGLKFAPLKYPDID